MTKTTREYLSQYRDALLSRHTLPIAIGANPSEARQRVYSAEDTLRRSVKAGTKADLEISREMFKLHEHIRSITPQQALKELFA